jgi:hypothetical protein
MGYVQRKGPKIHSAGITPSMIMRDTKHTKNTHLKKIVQSATIIFSAFSQPNRAIAQRGSAGTAEKASRNSPSSGIPGLFDSNTVFEKSLVADLPSFAIDYGITDNLTLGTSALTAMSTLAWVTDGRNSVPPFLSIKARYRVFTLRNWTASFTGYLSGMRIIPQSRTSLTNQKQTLLYSGSSLNVAKSFEQGSAGVSFFTGKVSATTGEPTDKTYAQMERIVKLPAIWWRHTIGTTVESELLVATCLSLRGIDLTNSIRIDSEEACFGTRQTDPALRALLNWRSSEQWLWTAGAIWIAGWTMPLIPALGITFLTSFNDNLTESRDAE